MQGLLARLLQEQNGRPPLGLAPTTSPAPQPRPNAPGMPQPAQADPRFWQQPDFGMKLAIAGESLAAVGNNQVPNASRSLQSLYARRDARDDEADLEKSKAGLMSAMAGRLTPQQRAALAAMPKDMAVRILSQMAMQPPAPVGGGAMAGGGGMGMGGQDEFGAVLGEVYGAMPAPASAPRSPGQPLTFGAGVPQMVPGQRSPFSFGGYG